jgi:transcriptional regulator with XRE-family HTH domain
VAAEAATRIRAARRDARLTLEAVAGLSGVSRAMLSKVERGEKSPTLGVLIAIARRLGTTTSALIGTVPSDESVDIIRVKDRIPFLDPETGFQRHLRSPAHADHRVEAVCWKKAMRYTSSSKHRTALITKAMLIACT